MDGLYSVQKVIYYFEAQPYISLRVQVWNYHWDQFCQFYASQVCDDDSSVIEGIYIVGLGETDTIDVSFNVKKNLNFLLEDKGTSGFFLNDDFTSVCFPFLGKIFNFGDVLFAIEFVVLFRVDSFDDKRWIVLIFSTQVFNHTVLFLKHLFHIQPFHPYKWTIESSTFINIFADFKMINVKQLFKRWQNNLLS